MVKDKILLAVWIVICLLNVMMAPISLWTGWYVWSMWYLIPSLICGLFFGCMVGHYLWKVKHPKLVEEMDGW